MKSLTYNRSVIKMTDGTEYLLSPKKNFPDKKEHGIKVNSYTGEKLMVNEANGICYKLSKQP